MPLPKPDLPPRDAALLPGWLTRRGLSDDLVKKVLEHRDLYPLGKHVPDDLALELYETGKVNMPQMAEMWRVRSQSVSLGIKRARMALEVEEFGHWRDELPWGRNIDADAAGTYIDRCLQILVLQRTNPAKVSPSQRRQAEAFTAKLRELDAVVFYADRQYHVHSRRAGDPPDAIWVPA